MAQNLVKKQKMAREFQLRRETKNETIKRMILEENRIDILASILGYTIAPFHLAMLQHKYSIDIETGLFGERKDVGLYIGPRGFGKSTLMTVICNIWDILKWPDIRIFLVSKSDKKAKSFLTEIKAGLLNEDIAEIFGNQKGDKWDEGSIIVADRTRIQKEPTISTAGMDSQIASGHYNKISGDDLIDEENSATEKQRDKAEVFFYKQLEPTLEPGGQLDLMGTRYHHDDLYNRLMHNDTRFKKNTFIQSCFDRKGNSIWPEKFTTIELLEKKRNMGSIIFESQFEGQTNKMVGKIFNWDMFRWIDTVPDSEDFKVYQGVDLAISEKDTANKFAHCTVFFDSVNRKWIVADIQSSKLSFSKQTKKIVSKFEQYDPVRIGIESNNYQAAQYQHLRDNEDQELKNVGMRVIPIVTHKDKTTRAWKLSAEFENGNIIFVRGVCNNLAGALLSMPDGDGKDEFDALDIAITTSLRKTKKKRDKEPGLI